MSGAVVVTPSTGAAWATAWEQFEGIRKGMISLSLTNYDATTVPQIASGSWIEAAGSIYKWTGNDSITGSLTSDAINYVTMVPSGSGASAILTPTWSDSAPTWSDAYQGFYSGTTRYAGGCYYDGTNYPLKWVYTNRHAGPKIRYISPTLTGETNDDTDVFFIGTGIQFIAAATSARAYIDPQLGNIRGIVTELYAECHNYTDGSLTVDLRHCDLGSISATTMAQVTLNAVESQTDTSITGPVIDMTDDSYSIHIEVTTAGTDMYVSGIRIKVTEIVRC